MHHTAALWARLQIQPVSLAEMLSQADAERLVDAFDEATFDRSNPARTALLAALTGGLLYLAYANPALAGLVALGLLILTVWLLLLALMTLARSVG